MNNIRDELDIIVYGPEEKFVKLLRGESRFIAEALRHYVQLHGHPVDVADLLRRLGEQ